LKRPGRRRERIVLQLLFGGAAVVTLLILSVVFGYRSYQTWQAHRFASRAQIYLSWGDLKSAALTAKQVLEFDSSNADAFRVLADVAEREGLPAAIEWRRRVAANLPDSIPDAVALAKTTLKFGSIATAEATLNRIGSQGAKSAGYHEALAELALARRNITEAESQYSEAVKLDPQNRAYRMNLAMVQIRSSDTVVRDRSARLLQEFLEDKELRLPAARALLEDAIERKDPSLVQIAQTLRGFSEASFLDRLISLQIFTRLQLPDFASALTETQEEAAKDPNKLTALFSWMSTNNLSVLALDWLKRLPPEIVMQRPVYVAVADCYVAAKDCAGLERWCKKGNWPGLEFLQHAYLAHAFRDCNDSFNADVEWSKALKNATSADAIETLQRGAAKWGWTKESVDLLWTLTKNSDKQKGALATLYGYYADLADTGNLYRVASRLSQVAPDDAQVQNNFAQLSLLLNVDTDRARTIARQLYERDAKDANLASTYAYALYSGGQTKRAVQVMSALKEKDLKRPEIAAYYGIFLAAAGEQEKAQQFLERSSQAHLLPEEKKLVEQAAARP
jgi:Tfp pilus assembly protein PilF